MSLSLALSDGFSHDSTGLGAGWGEYDRCDTPFPLHPVRGPPHPPAPLVTWITRMRPSLQAPPVQGAVCPCPPPPLLVSQAQPPLEWGGGREAPVEGEGLILYLAFFFHL